MNFLKGIFLFIIIISTGNLIGQNDWVKVRENSNLIVYTKLDTTSGIKEIRIKTNVKTTTEKLFSTIHQVEKYSDWVYKCSTSKVIKSNTESDYFYYSKTDFPFPFADRDLVVHSTQWIEEETGIIHSRSVSAADFLAAKPGIIRITEFESHWIITPLKDGNFEIEYFAKTCPGGNIPIWLINSAVTEGPFQTMKKFRKEVEGGVRETAWAK